MQCDAGQRVRMSLAVNVSRHDMSGMFPVKDVDSPRFLALGRTVRESNFSIYPFDNHRIKDAAARQGCSQRPAEPRSAWIAPYGGSNRLFVEFWIDPHRPRHRPSDDVSDEVSAVYSCLCWPMIVFTPLALRWLAG